MEPASSDRTLVIMSYGIVPARDLTLGTLAALRHCDVVFHLSSHSDLAALLDEHGIPAVDLQSLYAEGWDRKAIYRRITEHVLEEARRRERVGYLGDGNPMVFDAVVAGLVREAARLGMHVEVLPALSFVDAILAAGRIAIDGRGLRLVEATALTKSRTPLDSGVPLLVAQIGALGDLAARGTQEKPQAACHYLVEHLRGFYPAEHEVTVFDVGRPGCEDATVRVPLAALALLAPGLSYTSSLFVPAVAADPTP